MSVLVVLVALAAVFATQAHPITHAHKERLFSYHKDCLAKTGVNEITVEKTHDGQFNEDPKLKEYMFCLSQKIGVLNETGDMQLDVIRKELGKYITDTTEVDKIVEKCAIQRDTPVETAFAFFKCCCMETKHVDLSFYVIPITEEKRQTIKKYCKECMEDTKVEVKLVEAVRKGEFSGDPSFKQYLLCMSKKLGFQNGEGSIQRDVIKEKLSDVLKDAVKADKLIDTCIVEKEMPEDTALVILKCLYQKTHVNFIQNMTDALPTDKREKLTAYNKECLAQTSVDMNLVDATRKGNFPEDLKLKEYFFCLSKKAEFQNEIGDIRKDILRQKLNEIIMDPVMSQKLIDKCAVKKDTPQNTAFSTVKCYYENTPSHINIFQVVTLSDEQKLRLTKYNAECQTESEVESDVLDGVKKGQFPDNEKFKNHLFCFYRKLGLQNDAGEVQKDVLSEKFGKLLRDAALSERLVEKCAIQRDSPQNTAYNAFTCYFENSPSRFNIFTLF